MGPIAGRVLPPRFIGKGDSQILLKDLADWMRDIKLDRIVIFEKNNREGVVRGVLHENNIQNFFGRLALPAADGSGSKTVDPASATLDDLLKDKNCYAIFYCVACSSSGATRLRRRGSGWQQQAKPSDHSENVSMRSSP